MKVIRILEYEGPEEWVKDTLAKSYCKPGQRIHIGHKRTIKCTELTDKEAWIAVEAKDE